MATGAAAALSWWGVHTVLAGTAYDPPRAVPIAGDAPADPEPAGGEEPQSSATRRSTSPSATPSREASGKPGGRDSDPPPDDRPSSPGTASDGVKSYSVTGGRVVFDLGEYSASLVSATPAADWQMQVWKQPEWIRVNFTQGTATTSVFCTWNGHPPTVQIVQE